MVVTYAMMIILPPDDDTLRSRSDIFGFDLRGYVECIDELLVSGRVNTTLTRARVPNLDRGERMPTPSDVQLDGFFDLFWFICLGRSGDLLAVGCLVRVSI